MITILALSVGISLGITINVYAEQSMIPSWIKNTAKWWADGQTGDADFINALQWLINQKILVVPQSNVSGQNSIGTFSNTICSRDELSGFVKMSGKFTNGPSSYYAISLKLGVLNEKGDVVATGVGMLYNVEPYQTRIFDAEAVYSDDFSSCEINIDATGVK